MPKIVTRREVLLGSASLLLVGPAAALTIEENAPRERLYLSACETRNTHDAVIQQLVTELESGQTVTPELHAATVEKVKAQRCPTCGCALGSVEPYTGKF